MPSQSVSYRAKVAVIRDPNDVLYPVGHPAPMFLNCPCGAQPATPAYGAALISDRVTCYCGAIYTADGWLLAGVQL